MKRILSLLGLILIITGIGYSQNPFSRNFSFTATEAKSSIDITNLGINFFKLVWVNRGSSLPSACTVLLQISNDNANWTTGISGTCTTDGASSITQIAAPYIRINVTTYTKTAANAELIVNVSSVAASAASVTGGGDASAANQSLEITSLQLIDNIVSGTGANISQINGVVPLMGNGTTGTGSPRVTIASDNTPFHVVVDSGGGGGTQYNQGTASTATDTMTIAGAVRRDTPALDAGVADGDRATLGVNATGSLWTSVTNITVDSAVDAPRTENSAYVGGIFETTPNTVASGDATSFHFTPDQLLLVTGYRGSFTDKSGAITTGGTSQTAIGANTARHRVIFQNLCSATTQNIATAESLFINFTSAASATSGSFEILPCGSYDSSIGPFTTEAITVVGATTAHRWIAKEQ